MGLFDFFKKKPSLSELDNLSLEIILQKASSEPAYRPLLYKRLLSDELVVLTKNSPFKGGNQIAQVNTDISLISLEDKRIPVFTSTERIFDKGVIKEQVEFLKMKGEDLFKLAKNATFVLNPYSDFGKDLIPTEIEGMLDGTILTYNSKRITITKPTNIIIGQPAKYPTEIVNSLKILFANNLNVKSAHVGWYHNPESKVPPHYIIGIDADGDFQGLTQQAGFTTQQFLSKGELVDFIKMDTRGGIRDYFLNKTEPFYKREN
jgi:hypothetical protein